MTQPLKSKVVWKTSVQKQLARLPNFIAMKFHVWVADVELVGIQEVRKLPGYHDEPLSGKRLGQRSVRLNRSWRVIYQQVGQNRVYLLEVLEITNHEY
jgi:proteic killer suppression protein